MEYMAYNLPRQWLSATAFYLALVKVSSKLFIQVAYPESIAFSL